jgi:tetratricopeptide (TPR) repeat protein
VISPKAQHRAALLLLAALFGCARPRAAPIPEGIDLVYPALAPGTLVGGQGRQFQKAWEAVLAGDTGKAIRGFEELRRKRPGVVAIEAGLGYARLRRGDLEGAARGFEAAVLREPRYLPALVGAGATARRRGQGDKALDFYRRAAEAAPDDVVARRRFTEVKLQLTERHVGAAALARQRGDETLALVEYRAALAAAPELADVRIELANLLLKTGDRSGAVAVLEADPSGERHVLLALGELLASQKEYARALEAFRKILLKSPQDGEVKARANELRRDWELQQMPEEYRRIPQAPRVTRADLAALIDSKVTALHRLPEREPHVATDISGSWARGHILRVLSLEILDVYPNHTFQPGAIVRRGELAAALGKVLDLLGFPTRDTPVLKDMSPTNLLYPGATRVVAAGLMDVTPEGSFEPWRVVSGSDTWALVEALARLVGP